MQRCTVRVENFGGFFAAAIFDLLAIHVSKYRPHKGAVFKNIERRHYAAASTFIDLYFSILQSD